MKATFNNMKLKVNTEVKTLTIREDMDSIEVKQYLPIKDKIDKTNREYGLIRKIVCRFLKLNKLCR